MVGCLLENITAARNKFTTANNEWYTANNVIPTILYVINIQRKVPVVAFHSSWPLVQHWFV